MKFSQQLCKQHIGWHFKRFWLAKGALKVIKTEADEILAQHSIPVCEPDDILKEKRTFTKIEVIGNKPKPIVEDETHPRWHQRSLLTYKDNNVLLEGLTQAKILTKSVEVKRGLPDNISLKSTKNIDSRIKEIIMSTHVFDAEQKKLPIVKDPERPAWNFPRMYGITRERINKLLISNLLHLIETTSNWDVVKKRSVVNDLMFSYHFERFGNLIQFQLRGDTLLVSTEPLPPVNNETLNNFDLPDIFPIIPTITLVKENIYTTENIYPINLKLRKSHPHTLFVHHNETELANLFEEPVTESQIYGRSLLKTFTVAASYAQQKYGNGIKELPEPITVQCVQTNGRLFHFGVLQLNTLNLEDGESKNVWYQTERLPLFDSCSYKLGEPLLEDYNNDVIKHLYAFYNN